MPTSSYEHTIPVEMLHNPQPSPSPNGPTNGDDEKVRQYVIAWRDKLKQGRLEKLSIWNECWALYRGQDDHSAKEDWQSKIVLPKAWGTVKQATNVIKRLLNTAQRPWHLEALNTNDPLEVLKSEKMTSVDRVFLERAHFVEELMIGLETGFIMGLGVWKAGWNLLPRVRMSVQTTMVPAPQGAPPQGAGPSQFFTAPQQAASTMPVGQPAGAFPAQQAAQFPTQLPQEALLPSGSLNTPPQPMQMQPMMVPQKQIVREEIMEGELFIRAVDPYNFYWLPGSKLNRWTGTIEEIEINKWELMKMAELGAFDPELIAKLGPKKLDEVSNQSYLRFGELAQLTPGPTPDTGTIKLTEFYGPYVQDGRLVNEYAHIIVANDTWVIKNEDIQNWDRKPPYRAFSPVILPFRTEGMGLVEMVRSIDKALNQIVNLGVDTLLFRLLPIFEFTPDVYENPEDLRTGLTPGKILRRSQMVGGQELGLRPVQFEDVSPGAIQVAGVLDRAHQEGGLVSELQQSLPRWSGAQTATETEAIQQNQNSFFGAMATDIEQFCIAPLIELANDLIMQYIDTASDPRLAAILGVDEQILAGMSQPEILEMVQGEYLVKVKGLSGSLEKAEMLQQLVQFMNLIGQNPQAWLPWIKQDELLRRVLEAFSPGIHDIEKILNDPQTAQTMQQQMQQQEQMQHFVQMIPQLAQMAHQQKADAESAESKKVDQALALHQQLMQDKQHTATLKHKPPGGK